MALEAHATVRPQRLASDLRDDLIVRVGERADHQERQLRVGCDRRHLVAFHVDRLGAGRLKQRPLVGCGGHDALAAQQGASLGARGRQRSDGRAPVRARSGRPTKIAAPALRTLSRQEQIARAQLRREPAGEPEADQRRGTLGHETLLPPIAPARRCRRCTRCAHPACAGSGPRPREPVTTADGGAVALRSHMPQATRRSFLAIRFW